MKIFIKCFLVFNGDSEDSQARRRKQKPRARCRRYHGDKAMMILALVLLLVLVRAYPESFVALVQLLNKLSELLSIFQ